MTIKISIDCMGGDHGASVTVPAAVAFLKQHADVELVLVGAENTVRAELSKTDAAAHPRIFLRNATEVVAMDDSIETAMRRKRDSSMRVALELVRDGQVQACISAGNTGALMAISRYLLKTLPGVERPAICTILPNQKGGPTYVLDLGANVDCEPEHLHQFARMASALVACVEGKSRPTVGLLNVGTEEIKGNDVVKQASILMRDDHRRGMINYYGNVEGNDIFEGTTDIVVCDGFVGNIALKTAEGLGRFFRSVLKSEFKSSLINMLGAIIANKAIKAISQRMNPSRFNGASLLGLRGLVFKSHGSADAYAYECAIQRAYDAVRHDVLQRITTTMAELLTQPEVDPSVVEATSFEQKTA